MRLRAAPGLVEESWNSYRRFLRAPLPGPPRTLRSTTPFTMTHDKFTALASLVALSGLLSLSAVVSAGRRPQPSALRPDFVEPPQAESSLRVAIPVPEPTSSLAQAESIQEREPEPQKQALVAPFSLQSVGRCLDNAVTDNDLKSARECLLQELGQHKPGAQELAAWVCGLPEGRLSQAQVMLEVVLGALPAERVLGYAEEVQAACPTLEESDLLERAILASLAADAAWGVVLSEELQSAQLFDPLASPLAIGVAHQIALRGDDSAREMLELGASGLFGGSEEQILQASILGLQLQRDGGESLSFLTGIVESQFTPGSRGMGSFLADSLLQPGHWEGGDPSGAVALLNRILGDERFRLSAGRALAGNLEAAPLGAEERAWAELMESPSFQHLKAQVLLVAPD